MKKITEKQYSYHEGVLYVRLFIDGAFFGVHIKKGEDRYIRSGCRKEISLKELAMQELLKRIRDAKNTIKSLEKLLNEE